MTNKKIAIDEDSPGFPTGLQTENTFGNFETAERLPMYTVKYETYRTFRTFFRAYKKTLAI